MLSFGNSWPSSSSCRNCGQADSAVTPTVIVALFDSEGIALVLNLSTSMHDSHVSHLYFLLSPLSHLSYIKI